MDTQTGDADLAHLQSALSRLSVQEFEVVSLYCRSRLEVTQIAGRLQTSPNEVKRRLSQARHTLLRWIEVEKELHSVDRHRHTEAT